jgi:hypothetical protein
MLDCGLRENRLKECCSPPLCTSIVARVAGSSAEASGGIFRGFFLGRMIMTNQDAPFDLNDRSETFIKETSDEALEAAASSGPLAGRSFTLAMCTGQAECPF